MNNKNVTRLNREKVGYTILLFSMLIAIVGIFFFAKPIVQSEEYHQFSDAKTILGVSNFWNVVSNIPFLIIGIIGLLSLKSMVGSNRMYVLMFAGIALISVGSAYYHLDPNNNALVWDRLPMTILFMSLFSIVISEFVSKRAGDILFVPLILIGLLSIAYWVLSESGDLRLYILVQFYPLIAIPVILLFFESRYTRASAYWFLILLYVIAKLCEYFDSEIYEALVFFSGHSLKHIAAAIGLYILIDSYRSREISNWKSHQ